MQYVNRANFIKAFQSMKRIKHLNSTDVAKRSHLSRTYVYHLSSKKSNNKRITVSTVEKIARGFGLNETQTRAWLSTMMVTKSTENSYIHHRHQVLKQRAHDRKVMEHNYSKVKVHPTNVHYRDPMLHVIRDIMSTKGINTRKLAIRSGLKARLVNDFINGKTNYIPKIAVIRLAQGLGVNAKKLMNADEKTVTHSHHRLQPELRTNHSPRRIHVDPSVFKVAKRLSRLNDADLAIINMIINRLADAEKNERQ